jgi:hypothetical protein
MTRYAVPLLLAAFATPAAAQVVPPAPPPPPPVLQPLQPAQPFVVPAQPVPPQFIFPPQPARGQAASGEPRVVVAKIVDGALSWKTSGVAPVAQQVQVVVQENGQPVTRVINTTAMQQTPKQVTVPLDGVKFTDAAGKKLQPLAVENRLGEGRGVVLHNGPIAAELRGMFKDDTIFVELPGGPAAMIQPAVMPGIPAGGGLRVQPAQPAPLLDLLPAQPAPAPAPPPPAPPRR